MLQTLTAEPISGGMFFGRSEGVRAMTRRGHVEFFLGDRPSPATRTLHGGAPVIEGEKWIATKWLRERTFQ